MLDIWNRGPGTEKNKLNIRRMNGTENVNKRNSFGKGETRYEELEDNNGGNGSSATLLDTRSKSIRRVGLMRRGREEKK